MSPLYRHIRRQNSEGVPGNLNRTSSTRYRTLRRTEQDPWADMVSAIVRRDLLLRLDILLIMGTSLGTHGVKRLVKDFAKAGSFTNGLEKRCSRTSQNELRAGTA
jgi:hypothetical protein